MKSKVYFSSTQARGYHENKISKIKNFIKQLEMKVFLKKGFSSS